MIRTHEKATYEKETERETRLLTYGLNNDSTTGNRRIKRTHHVYDNLVEHNMPYRIKYFMLSALLILAICIGSIFIVKASDRNTKSLNKYYTSVIVQENDTLWEIADQYSSSAEDRSTYINAVKKLNHMSTDILYKGQNLLVYYYSEEVK